LSEFPHFMAAFRHSLPHLKAHGMFSAPVFRLTLSDLFAFARPGLLELFDA
jgi:hypothetical protein